MKIEFQYRHKILIAAFSALALSILSPVKLVAQNPDMQQKVADLKEAMAKNKQMLAQYTWTETTTISLKGEQKKQEHYQVRLGPDGKEQKTPLDAQEPPPPPSGGRLKQHVVAKKKEEFKEYADQIKELVKQYLPPDKDMIEQAKQKGNISMSPGAGEGQFSLVFVNYVKQGDKMTFTIDKAQKGITGITVNSYLGTDPKDAVNVNVQFASIPGGPNHIASEAIEGVSKQLNIAVENSNYQKM
ncbi:MAG TPA: hypothetical protein VF753_00940 [Terriglobales bacterium]